MHPHKSLRPSNTTTISSTKAFILPQVVEIASGSEGFVTKLFVRERDEIRRGQDVLDFACARAHLERSVTTVGQEVSPTSAARANGPATAADEWQRVTLKASVTGIVSSCHVRPGDIVRRGRPVVSVLRADDVLVVARFDAGAAPWVRRARTAWVHIPRAGAYCMPARIIRIGGSYPWQTGPWALWQGGAVRVVAQLSCATFDALSPGIEAVVEISSVEDAA
jgi:multidrug resistance efflux pump